MSYTNPQQFVPQGYAQQNQQLQNTIAGSVAKLGAQYSQQQKELRAKNERTTRENKATQGKINDRALRLLTSLGDVDNANPSVDFASTYEPLIEQYKSLSESVAFGTSEDPVADQKRIDDIYSSVSKITGTMSNLVSFTEDFGSQMDNVGEPGGLFSGNDPSLIEGLSIMTSKLDGKRVPKFKDPNDLNSFVWEIYNKEGELVTEFSQERLEQISQGIDELVTTVPISQDENNKAKIANKDIFVTKETNGKFAATGEIQDAFLGKTELGAEQNRDSKGNATYGRRKKINKDAIYVDSNFNTTMDTAIANVLGDGQTDRSAVALYNTSFNKIDFTEEDFRKGLNGKYAKGELPKEIQEVINDKENDGYEMDFSKNLEPWQKEVFNVAYKKNFLKNDVPEYQNVKGTFTQRVEGDPTISEQKQGNTKKLTDYLYGKITDKYKIKPDKEGGKVKIKNSEFVAEQILNDTKIDSEVRQDFKPLTKKYMESQAEATGKDFLLAQKGDFEGVTLEELDKPENSKLKIEYNSYIKKENSKLQKAFEDGKIWDSRSQTGVTVDEMIRKISKRQDKLGTQTDFKIEPIVY